MKLVFLFISNGSTVYGGNILTFVQTNFQPKIKCSRPLSLQIEGEKAQVISI